jgi:hypothetical protein
VVCIARAVFYKSPWSVKRLASSPGVAPLRPRTARPRRCTRSFILAESQNWLLYQLRLLSSSTQSRRQGCPAKCHEPRARHTSIRAPHDSRPAAATATTLVYRPQIQPMTTSAQDDPLPSMLLGPMLEHLPDLFQKEVLRRLGPTDLASLAGVGRGCAAAVASTALMLWAKHAKLTPRWYFGFYLPPLCMRLACLHAARGGHREVLEWLHMTGAPWGATTCAIAAMGGHLAVLQWAREHGCTWDPDLAAWDPDTCAQAARSGHLRVLQWARKHHCPWNWWTPAWAAAGGHLEVLQWVRENDVTGAVWSESRVRDYAGGPRQQQVLTWLDELSGP